MLKVGVTDNGIGMTPEEMTNNLVRVFLFRGYMRL